MAVGATRTGEGATASTRGQNFGRGWSLSAFLGLPAVVSGEYRDVDRLEGYEADDTGITCVSVGPRVVASLGKISAEVAVELPVLIDNTVLQVVQGYRISGAMAFRF